MAMRVEERDKLKSVIREKLIKRAERVGNEIEADLKDTVSVEPANIRYSRTTGRVYTNDPATPGAPPRKVSGQGRMSIRNNMVITFNRVQFIFSMRNYMAWLEKRNHPWFHKTIAANKAKYIRIMKGEDISDTHKGVTSPTIQGGGQPTQTVVQGRGR